MIGQAPGHRRGTGYPGELAGLGIGSGATQFLMRPTENVSATKQIHPRVQSGQPMGGMSTLSRQGGQALAHRPIKAPDKGGIEHAPTS